MGGSKDEMTFYYIKMAENVEMRDWDNFWPKVEDKEEFLDRLNKCRNVFKGTNKKELSLEKSYRYTLAKEIWKDMLSNRDLYLGAYWSKIFCEELLPKDELEYWDMQELNKASFYYYNKDKFNMNIPKVYSFDISSSHLSFLMRKKFPYKGFKRSESLEETQKVISGKFYCYYGCFMFHKLQYKIDFPIDLSTFGQRNENEQCSWNLWLTNVDMEWFKKMFSWEKVQPIEFYYSQQKELPRDYAKAFDIVYKQKKFSKKGTFAKEIFKYRAELPFGQGIKKIEYSNGLFYDNLKREFYIEEIEPLSFEKNKFTLKKRGMPYYVSLWVAAYSRLEEFNMIYKIGIDNVVYGDTDSVKFTGEEGFKIIEEHNKEIYNELLTISRKRGMEGIIDMDMGQWKRETDIAVFKAIGVKWYLTEDINGKLDVKAAGANIEALTSWLEKQPSPFAAFSHKMKVPKLFHRYGLSRTFKNAVCEFWQNKMDKDFRQDIIGKRTQLYYYEYGQEVI